jgi:hypothetical protein
LTDGFLTRAVLRLMAWLLLGGSVLAAVGILEAPAALHIHVSRGGAAAELAAAFVSAGVLLWVTLLVLARMARNLSELDRNIAYLAYEARLRLDDRDYYEKHEDYE